MKKLVLKLLFTVLLILFSFSFLYTKNEYDKIKKDNSNLIIEIEKMRQSLETKIENNSNAEIEKTTLEKSNKEKIEEQNIWLEMKEKLKQALS